MVAERQGRGSISYESIGSTRFRCAGWPPCVSTGTGQSIDPVNIFGTRRTYSVNAAGMAIVAPVSQIGNHAVVRVTRKRRAGIVMGRCAGIIAGMTDNTERNLIRSYGRGAGDGRNSPHSGCSAVGGDRLGYGTRIG